MESIQRYKERKAEAESLEAKRLAVEVQQGIEQSLAFGLDAELKGKRFIIPAQLAYDGRDHEVVFTSSTDIYEQSSGLIRYRDLTLEKERKENAMKVDAEAKEKYAQDLAAYKERKAADPSYKGDMPSPPDVKGIPQERIVGMWQSTFIKASQLEGLEELRNALDRGYRQFYRKQQELPKEQQYSAEVLRRVRSELGVNFENGLGMSGIEKKSLKRAA